MEKICGIYKITNKINNKCYIGQSVDIYQRWDGHRSSSRPIEDGGDNFIIHNAIRKYGLNNFSFEIIEKTNPSQLNEREKYWINYYDSYYNGYNATLGGDGSVQYDYQEIVSLWQIGNTCKEICEILQCDDQVVTTALRAYNIPEEEVRSRSNIYQRKSIVAIDILSNQPLKVFSSQWHANKFLTGKYKGTSYLSKAIKNHYRWEGYYWEFLNENNHPISELSDEEFLKHKQEKMFVKSTEMRQRISESNRFVERCSREELKALIRNTPFTTIGKHFNVSDNAIRKWCDFYNLPRRVKDIKAFSDEEWINI